MESLLSYLREGLVQNGQATVQSLAPFSVQLALAVVILLTTRILATKAQNSIAKALFLAKADTHVTLLTARSARLGVWSIGLLVTLGVFGVGWTAIATTFGVVGLAITVSLQDVLKNFVAGIYVLVERPFRIGDVIRVKDYSGTVEDVRLRTTCLRAADGNQIIIPNSTIFIEVVVNSGAVAAAEEVGANERA